MNDNPVFYDPQRKRWKRLRRIFDVLALIGLVLGALFVVGLLRTKPLPELLLPLQKRNFRTLANTPAPVMKPGQKKNRAAHRRTDRRPSDIPLNTGEGLRAAYYVEDDPASYSSLRQHVKQIDLLFPEWLHVVTPDGGLTSYTIDNRPYKVVDSAGVHQVDRDNKVARVIVDAHEDTEIFPLVNNYDPTVNKFLPSIGVMLQDPAARANFIQQTDVFLARNPAYRGLSLDLEEIPEEAQPGFNALIAALYADFHPRNLRLYVNTPVSDDDFNLKYLADHSDGLLLMNYDQHQTESGPGPIAAQDWFIDNLTNVLKIVPKSKVICSLGSYGYDWTSALPETAAAVKGRKPKKPAPADEKVVYSRNLSTQDAWQAASDSDSEIELDPDSLNAHFAYDDDDAHLRHQVWFLDAVTVLNQMRAARALGIQTFALWQLGSEDYSLWSIWDAPQHTDPVKALANVEPGYDVDNEGSGDIMRVTRKPQTGHRTVTMDDDDEVPAISKSVTQEKMDKLPLSYTVEYYGYQPKQVALTFDDGPDPTWTPRILDVLKKYGVSGTFFMIGEEAQDNVGVMRRVYREGHEIGNHTYTHPDISAISNRQIDLQLNFTERLFASKLGVQPLYFRPPYSIDQEPDTNDQAAPIDRIQGLGYVIVGNKIDTDDWDEHPRKSPKEITESVFQTIADMETHPWTKGSVILLHDGGGDRSATVAALPMLIETLRARGYQIVPVSRLVGKTRDQVMPSLTPRQRWQAAVDSIAFFFISFFNHFVVGVFFVGDVLMSARLIIIGLFATIDRFRKRKNFATAEYQPRVAVLVPAYNEEKVIVRTIRSVMMSNYKNIRVIVIDDGSKRPDERGGARSLSAGHRLGPADRTDEAERRQGGRAELCARADRRRDLRRHRRGRRDRA